MLNLSTGRRANLITFRVDTDDYTFSHGKQPRGAGLWFVTIYDDTCQSMTIEYNGLYGQAIQAAKQAASAAGWSGHVEVCPQP